VHLHGSDVTTLEEFDQISGGRHLLTLFFPKRPHVIPFVLEHFFQIAFSYCCKTRLHCRHTLCCVRTKRPFGEEYQKRPTLGNRQSCRSAFSIPQALAPVAPDNAKKLVARGNLRYDCAVNATYPSLSGVYRGSVQDNPHRRQK